MTDTDLWIMRPFNALFCLVFAAFILLLVIVSLLLRGKSESAKKAVLVTASVATLIGFFVYKYQLSLDAEYNELTADMGGFNWWGELPLQLCNINMLLLPAAVLRKNRGLMSFCFYLGPLGALMALAMPVNGFDGYSLLLPRMLGFYGTHFMVLIQGLALASFGLYRPRFRDLPLTALTALAVAFAVFLFDLFLRRSGLHPRANYFFAMETEGNPILELFHRLIPVPYLYLVLCLGILCPYMVLVTLPFALADRRRKKEAAHSAAAEGEVR